MYIEKVGWLFCDRFYFLLDFALEEDDEDEVVEEDVAALSCFSRAAADF